MPGLGVYNNSNIMGISYDEMRRVKDFLAASSSMLDDSRDQVKYARLNVETGDGSDLNSVHDRLVDAYNSQGSRKDKIDRLCSNIDTIIRRYGDVDATCAQSISMIVNNVYNNNKNMNVSLSGIIDSISSFGLGGLAALFGNIADSANILITLIAGITDKDAAERLSNQMDMSKEDLIAMLEGNAKSDKAFYTGKYVTDFASLLLGLLTTFEGGSIIGAGIAGFVGSGFLEVFSGGTLTLPVAGTAAVSGGLVAVGSAVSGAGLSMMVNSWENGVADLGKAKEASNGGSKANDDISPGKAAENLGAVREQKVADMVDGKVSREDLKSSAGSTDLDVEGPNGELIMVGGPAKAKDLGKLGQVIKIYQDAAIERGGVPVKAYFAEGTPQNVIDFASKKLGAENVVIFKD